MPNLVDGDIVELTFIVRQGTDGSVNKRCFRIYDSLLAGVSEVEVASHWFTVMDTHYSSLMTGSAALSEVRCQKVWPLPVSAGAIHVGVGTPGIRGVDALPAQVSLCVTLKTALAGRKNRGRIFLPFFDESDNTAAGAPSAGIQGVCAVACNEFVGAEFIPGGGGSCNMQPVIWTRANPVAADITSLTVRNRWKTQRRRANGRF